MAHGDAREGKWRGNWRMEWVTRTLHTTSENGVSNIITADAHTSAASCRLNWRPPCRFKWTRPFRLKTKISFCACAITFQTQSTCSRQFYGIGSPHTVRYSCIIYGSLSCKAKTKSHFQVDTTAEPRDTINEHYVSDYKNNPSLNVCTCGENCKKLNQSHYRPRVAQRVPGS